MKLKSITVRDSGTELMLSAGSWNHPLSKEEGQQLKETLRRLLNQSIGYDFEVLLPEDGGAESVIIDRENAFTLFVELKRMFHN